MSKVNESSKEINLVKSSTLIYVAILSVLIGILIPFWFLLGRSGLKFWTDLGLFSEITSVSIAEYFLLFLAWILSRVKPIRSRLNLHTLTYLYIVGICSAFYAVIMNEPVIMAVFSRTSMAEALSQEYVPWFMAPPKSIVAGLSYGGASFQLGTWAPILIFWWILYTIPGLLLISIVVLFRRLWMEVERVPFPYTGIVYESLKRIPESASRGRRLSMFMIGLIVGLAFQGVVFITQIFPWFPDIFAIRGNCCGYVWYVRAGTPLAPIIGLATANLQPVMVAIAFFVPLKILFNSWFWYLVYIVLMQVAFYMGYYTGADGANGCGRGWCAGFSGLIESPYKFMAVSQAGGMIGLVVMSLWLSRSYITGTLRAAFGKKDENIERIESGEPMSYRMTWILLILSFIGTIAIFMTMGLGFVAAFLMPITLMIYYFANARLYGMSGFYMRGMEHGTSLYRAFLWPSAPATPTREFVMTSLFDRTNMDVSSGKLFGSIFGSFASFKMASMTGTSTRDTFKVILVVTIIVPIVTLISLFLILGGSIGLNNAGAQSLISVAGLSNWGVSPQWNTMPASSPWVQYVIAGILIVCLLSWLNARFLWFPFEPIGFLNGTSYNSLISGMWTSFLVAWVLKTITLRVGGSKAYEDIGIPIAGGLVAGCIAIFVLGGFIGIIRFFVPF